MHAIYIYTIKRWKLQLNYNSTTESMQAAATVSISLRVRTLILFLYCDHDFLTWVYYLCVRWSKRHREYHGHQYHHCYLYNCLHFEGRYMNQKSWRILDSLHLILLVTWVNCYSRVPAKLITFIPFGVGTQSSLRDQALNTYYSCKSIKDGLLWLLVQMEAKIWNSDFH